MMRKLWWTGVALVVAGCLMAFWHWQHPEPLPAKRSASGTVKQTPVLNWSAIVHHLAGDGLRGFADGKGSAARFADPYGLARDGAGNIYVSDGGDNNLIRKIAPDGTVSTIAGGKEGFADGMGAAASFNTPSGLAIDAKGNLYVADTGNNAIRRIDTLGQVTTIAGDGQAGLRDGPAAQARFNGPLGLDVDQAGNLYVADTYNDAVRRISPDGQVTTVAGGHGTGLTDGAADAAQFDTPCGVLLDSLGNLMVADTRNDLIRKIDLGQKAAVSTLAQMHRPTGLAWSPDGLLYASDSTRGRIYQLSPEGEVGNLQSAVLLAAKGAPDITDFKLRLPRPAGLLVQKDGSLVLAAADSYRIETVRMARANEATPDSAFAEAQHTTEAARQIIAALPAVQAGRFSWPFKPQMQAHEVVGTLGEVRGNHDGESRDHLHGGLDVQAAMGTPVLAVVDEKISDPVSSWGFNTPGEGLCIDLFCYIHMRVGRDADGKALDSDRFLFQNDDQGKPVMVRVKRGTRFAAGDTLGTVNSMYHTHLALIVDGAEINPLTLPFAGLLDDVPPTIREVRLSGDDGVEFNKKEKGRLLLPAGARLHIVVEAYDQMNGNQKRRQLGLYRAGFQLLTAKGEPMPGHADPVINMDFERLPDDPDAVKIAYAGDSGITVYGSKTTRMRYELTNRVRDGLAMRDAWDTSELAPGNYILRLVALDFAGNAARSGRDLPITLAAAP
jgi:sugar lactone lactonase YvrE